jgi:hypothetical protein
MVVDECHRGYLLDREMSDMEMSFRSEATPALHTTQIFGEPIFTYSYPIAGWGDPLDKLMAPAPHEQAERCCNVR